MSGALKNIQVLDFSRLAPGPMAAMILGDLGADVIKIEELGGGRRAREERALRGLPTDAFSDDEIRRRKLNPFERNKRSITLNLKTELGRQIAIELSRRADVIIEGFRPGVMQRLGLGYDTLRDVNPRLVYCSISGYGQEGARSRRSGHDLNYIATAGALSLFGDRDGQPIVPYNLIADYAGGTLHAVISILSALIAREHIGSGQFVDVSMTDGVLGLLGLAVADYLATGNVPKAGASRLTGGVSYYNVYKTKDGRTITVGCNEPWLYRNLCEAMELGELSDMQAADAEGQRYLYERFAGHFRERTLAEWEDAFKGHDIAYAPTKRIDEVLSDEEFRARGMVVEFPDGDGQPLLQIGSSIRLSATPPSVQTLASLPGQHTEEILKALGHTEADIEVLREHGVV